MKRLLLLVLVLLLFPTHSLGQIETTSYITLGRTLWSQVLLPGATIGFYRNKVYICDSVGSNCQRIQSSFYFDLFLFSSFIAEIPGVRVNGVLFPLIGIGSAKDSETNSRFNMYKISDKWVPFYIIIYKRPVVNLE